MFLTFSWIIKKKKQLCKDSKRKRKMPESLKLQLLSLNVVFFLLLLQMHLKKEMQKFQLSTGIWTRWPQKKHKIKHIKKRSLTTLKCFIITAPTIFYSLWLSQVKKNNICHLLCNILPWNVCCLEGSREKCYWKLWELVIVLCSINVILSKAFIAKQYLWLLKKSY